MSQSYSYVTNDDGTKGQPPDILRAAEFGDFNEGMAALRANPSCIEETDYHTGMNAIQISLLQGQESFVRFLLSNTKISVLYKDKLDRDALDHAIVSLCCSDETMLLVNERWYEQKRVEYVRKNVAQFPRNPSD